MGYFLHPQGICESERVGDGTRIWAFAHVLPGAQIGRDCNICDHTFIENDVIVGDRVTIKSGVQLWDGLRVEDEVFIGPNATFTNDPHPRSQVQPPAYPITLVRAGASIGANATILPGVTIGLRAMVGAGAVVTHSVPPFAIVVGNPARILGYVETGRGAADPSFTTETLEPGQRRALVGGACLHQLRRVYDLRGSLAVGEFEQDLPFVPRRYFVVFDVPSTEVRGEHAHRECHQFLVCLRGSCAVMIDDGRHREEIVLDRPDLGLHVPPMVWSVQYKYSADALLLVFASHPYHADDYIRDYEGFLESRRRAGA